MNDTKSWLASKTVWGGVIAVLAAVAGLFGLPIDTGMQEEAVAILTAIAGGVGGLLAIWGRLKANKRVE